MKYLCLAYYNVHGADSLSAAELEAIRHECAADDAALRAGGHLVVAASLVHRSATTLRMRDRRLSVNEGHAVEHSDQVGAVFIIEARDLNEAIRVASLHPASQHGERLGWTVEVRPIERFEQR